MNIMGLDLSTKKTGWSFFEDGVLKDYGLFSSNLKDIRARTLTIKEEIKKIVKEKKIDRVVVEDLKISPGGKTSNLHTVVSLAVLQGCVLSICDDFGADFLTYDPSEWRKLTGVNQKNVKCKSCGWTCRVLSGKTVDVCPKCGEHRKTYFQNILLNKRKDVKKIAIDVVNKKYKLKLEFYASDTKKHVSDDDIAEAILIAQAYINEFKL